MAGEVRRREWTFGLELFLVATESLRRWREQKKNPTLADITKLFELAIRLQRMAAVRLRRHRQGWRSRTSTNQFGPE